ncbi:MAG TPA: (d)CMP kinase [Thermotogota bacterium]|nr:(d)CMP kinase [Thermotogota bacterium]NLH20432.1 (d)CMP kinase [Thermotogaceae bacterium]OQC32804.1 MAG: Cytidylate kinase [Thermotogota bacterium ADurb.Bin062]HNW46902.1 (d)CMP kinase [Thermotogota bacterium]HNY82749.1 (d)CMP kinase [Thermotogota bacterium]
MTKHFSIAIDGPSGSGKSSVAKAVAKACGLFYLDSGAFYRAIAYYLNHLNVDFHKEEECQEALKSIRFDISPAGITMNHSLLGEEIRTSEISQIASKVSVIPQVRTFVTEVVRELSKDQNVIMDGRDIGTVVLPLADLKLFITASVEERARRRQKELAQQGHHSSFEETLEEIKERDHRDISRALSPLKPAPDAILIDTTHLSFDQVVNKVVMIVREKIFL